ncbi:SRPBCC domain-containing protein [Kocuria sp. M1R5S2]|uniref:SRPBCC domain-containing protein n=1 Tax=Kocuria rhizosphaerae TaxID=3376285 RepID=UPI0037B4CA36
MTARPTGHLESGAHLVLTRTFRTSVHDLWAAVTETERLARWIGTWTGDPSSGRVEFLMTAENSDRPEPVIIRRCIPPHRLGVTLGTTADSWRVDLDLDDDDGTSLLRLTHRYPDPAELESVGPGWEYYLDRLVAAETGGDPDAVDFARDYHPAMSGYYRELAGQLRPPG